MTEVEHEPAAPRRRVHVFPHAGGSAVEYAGWNARTPGVDVVAMQPPGRASRFGDPLVTDVLELAREAAGAIADDVPFALFGHSFGALVAFETCRVLRDDGRRAPEHLWVSAFPPPDAIPETPELHTMPGTSILHELARRFDAIPPEVLEHEELAAIVAEYVRADYTALESYVHRPGPPLEVPITVLRATEDVRDGDPHGWARQSAHSCAVVDFPGGHFYLRDEDNAEAVCALLAGPWGRADDAPSSVPEETDPHD